MWIDLGAGLEVGLSWLWAVTVSWLLWSTLA